jgi:plastocyanin
MFTPKWIDLYVGDTVTWRWNSQLEPHNVAFGPAAMLKKLADAASAPMVSSSGAPVIGVPPQVAYPTTGHTFNGVGYATSGLSFKGTWSLTFTMAGTYKYYCLIHYPMMVGRGCTERAHEVAFGPASEARGPPAAGADRPRSWASVARARRTGS